MPEFIKDAGPVQCRTAGYLLTKTKKYITVVQNRGEDTGNVGEAMNIPRSCVKRIRRLS